MIRPNDTKQRLMDAATSLMWESGYASTSVDAICERAGVKKGSFYHFFESKSHLSVAALEADWQVTKLELDAIFSPTVPPLERFERYFKRALDRQTALKEKTGSVLGCPRFTLGAEISTLEQAIRTKVEQILGEHVKYLTSAVRDAQDENLVRPGDAGERAQTIFNCYQGTMMLARIQNELEPLRRLTDQVFDMLGAKTGIVAD
jgi:TetR/AcrR family transcriptional repressor of nem operon